MHVRSSVAHQFLDKISPYLQRCEVLASEMNLDEFDHVAMVQGSGLPPGTSLESLMGSKKYVKARKSVLNSFHVDLDHFKTRHPFFANAAISESLMVNDQLESLDQEIWNRSKDLNMTRVGLESFMEQLTIMQKISPQDSIGQIKYIGRNPGNFRRNLQKLINFYVDQDVNKLYKSSRKQLEGMRKTLLFDRNRIMARRLSRLIADQSVFAAIGAAHLAGAKGMLRLIKHHGFLVKPVIL